MAAQLDPREAYARLERTRDGRLCYEPLGRHLACVALAASTLTERLYGAGVNLGGLEPAEAAAVAGVLHDVGKVLHNVTGSWFKRAIIGGREGRLTFRYHEILSAALAGHYMWTQDYDPAAVAAVVRPILFHHEGLRGVSTETVKSGLRWIGERLGRLGDRERGELARLLRDTLAGKEGAAEILKRLPAECGGPARHAARAAAAAEGLAGAYANPDLEALSEALDKMTDLLPHWLALGRGLDPKKREAVRVVTGMVMAADNAVARAASLQCPSSSVYVEDMLRLARSAGALQCPPCAQASHG